MHLKILFRLNIKKKLDKAADDFTLRNVNKFIQEIRLMEEKNKFKIFFNFHHQLIMQKCLLILKITIKIKNM